MPKVMKSSKLREIRAAMLAGHTTFTELVADGTLPRAMPDDLVTFIKCALDEAGFRIVRKPAKRDDS